MSFLKRHRSLYAVTLRSAAKNATSQKLIERQLEAAKAHPVNGIKRLIAPQSKPINYGEIGVLE